MTNNYVKEENWVKFRSFIVALCAVSMMICSAACGSAPSTTETTVQPAQEEAKPETDGVLGDAKVEIGDCVLAKTYEGKDAVVITLKYTNNADEAKSYMTSLISKAFQDGVELDSAIIMDESVYKSDSQMKELKKGASIDVQVAYELANTTSDVEFEVEEFLSFDEAKIEKTFAIAQ